MMQLPTPNRIIRETPDFYISYNSRDVNTYGCDTTAIVIGNMEFFFILNGNHVQQLNDLELDACLAYYNARRAQWSKYTEKFSTVTETNTASTNVVTVLRKIGIVEIDASTVSETTKAVMNDHFLAYRDANLSMNEHLYRMEEAEDTLKDQQLSLPRQTLQEIRFIQWLCRHHAAAYVRLVIE